MVHSYVEWCVALEETLTAKLPGTAAHLRMAPDYRLSASTISVQGKECRAASVLLAIFPEGDTHEPTLILTKRRDDLPDHAGQISLPGGRQEEGESLRETALRESKEEIALVPAQITVLGQLTPLFVPPSSYCVYPFVGVLKHKPVLRARAEEVDAIYRVPLNQLAKPSILKREKRTLNATPVTVPYFELSGKKVWGATAMILSEFLEIYRTVLRHFP